MRNIIIYIAALIFCFLATTQLYAQTNPLNAYRFIAVQTLYYNDDQADIYGISALLRKYFQDMGIQVIAENDESWPAEALNNPCLVLQCGIDAPKRLVGRKKVTVTITNCQQAVIFQNTDMGNAPTDQAAYQFATKYTVEELVQQPYTFNPTSALPPPVAEVSATQINEASAQQYLATLANPGIEGIYQSVPGQPFARLLLRKAKTGGYELIVLKANDTLWQVGEIQAKLQATTLPKVYRVTWSGYLKRAISTFGIYESNTLSVEANNEEGQPVRLDFQQNTP